MKAMRDFESRFGGYVIAFRWPIMIASLALVAAAASGTLLLEFSADQQNLLFPRDNPELLAYEAMENTYGKSRQRPFSPSHRKTATPPHPMPSKRPHG